MKSSSVSIVIVLALLSGCLAAPPRQSSGSSSVAGSAPAPRPPEPVSIQAFSRNPFRSVALPPSRMHGHEQAIAALGSPAKTVVEKVPDQYDKSLIHSLITLRYPFGELTYLRVAGKDVETLILISVRGAQQPLKYGIRIGVTTREQVLKTFGAPEQAQADSLSYAVAYTQEITSSTTFFFEGTALRRVDISSLMMD